MEIRILTPEQAKGIYDREMVRDFPAGELKPFAAIEDMLRRGIGEMLAFADDQGLAAYACQIVLPGCQSVLVDYLAVLPSRRGQGVGSAVLRSLAGWYAPKKTTLIIECEHPDEAPDPAAARRRIEFYRRAGAWVTPTESWLFGVRYKILALPAGGRAPDEEIGRDLRQIYAAIIPAPYAGGNVIFFDK